MKILIVDDSRAMQAIVRRALLQGNLGELDIQTAESGHAAFAYLQQNAAPDLILTDWHMPGMTGLELLQNVRQLGLNTTEVGFITTENQSDRLAQAARNGASFVLNKPFKDDDLLAKVQGLIKKRPPTKVSVLDEPALSQVLRRFLGEVPFRLVERDMGLTHLSAQNLLVLFRPEGKQGVVALGVMDSHCVAMLGLGMQGVAPQEARPQVELGRPSKEMQQSVGMIWPEVAAQLKHPSQAALVLHNHSMVSREFPKLQDLFRLHKGVSAFRLDIPGYGSGRMAFFLI